MVAISSLHTRKWTYIGSSLLFLGTSVKVLIPFATWPDSRKFVVFADFPCCLQTVHVTPLKVVNWEDMCTMGSCEPMLASSGTPLCLTRSSPATWWWITQWRKLSAHLLDKMNHPVLQMKFIHSSQVEDYNWALTGFPEYIFELFLKHYIPERGINHILKRRLILSNLQTKNVHGSSTKVERSTTVWGLP